MANQLHGNVRTTDNLLQDNLQVRLLHSDLVGRHSYTDGQTNYTLVGLVNIPHSITVTLMLPRYTI